MLHYLNIYKIWQHKKFILPQQRNTTIELSNYKIAQNAKQSFSIAHNCVMINSSINFRLSFWLRPIVSGQHKLIWPDRSVLASDSIFCSLYST